MSLIDLNLDPTRIALALERIADALERVAPPIQAETLQYRKRGPESIVQYGNSDRLSMIDEVRSYIRGQGLSSEEERKAVYEVTQEYDKYQKENQ